MDIPPSLDGDPHAIALCDAFIQARPLADPGLRQLRHALRSFVDAKVSEGWSDEEILAGVRCAAESLRIPGQLLEDGYGDGMLNRVVDNAAMIALLRARIARAHAMGTS